jgi:tetrahydromethanopterin S-methyltransferase subunit F
LPLLEEAHSLSFEERLARLENTFEFEAEERGLNSRYLTELTRYIEDLRAEAQFIATARLVFGSLATVAAVGLLVAPIVLAYSAAPLFTSLPPYPKAALLIGMIAGGVLLIQA